MDNDHEIFRIPNLKENPEEPWSFSLCSMQNIKQILICFTNWFQILNAYVALDHRTLTPFRDECHVHWQHGNQSLHPTTQCQHMQIGLGRNACRYPQLTAYGFPLPITKLQTILCTILLAPKSAYFKGRKSLWTVADQIYHKSYAISTIDQPTYNW